MIYTAVNIRKVSMKEPRAQARLIQLHGSDGLMGREAAKSCQQRPRNKPRKMIKKIHCMPVIARPPR